MHRQPTITRQIRLEQRLPSYWRVTFDHPPLNIFGPETIPQLNDRIGGAKDRISRIPSSARLAESMASANRVK